MADQSPQPYLAILRVPWEGVGTVFSRLSREERLALVTATTEGSVNHRRLREISTDHPTDITRMLAGLVRDGWLVSEGIGRGMIYFLPWQDRRGVSLFDADGGVLGPSKLSRYLQS